MILKVAHSKSESTLYWYLDEHFVGTTKDIHDLAVQPKAGDHMITVVDEFGNELKRMITISE